MPLWLLDYNPYLVMDGHTAGCVFLEDFRHTVGETLVLQFGLLLAVLLLGEQVKMLRGILLKHYLESIY